MRRSGATRRSFVGEPGRAEGIARTAPLIPIGWGASIYGAKQMMSAQSKKMAKWFGMDTKGRFDVAEKSFQDRINREWLGIKSSWSSKDITDLESIILKGGDFMGTSISLWKEKEEWLSLSNTLRKPVLEDWLKTTKGEAAMKQYGANADFKFTTFKEIFEGDDDKNRMALHRLMWGDAAVYPSRVWDIWGDPKISYDQLMKNVYHRSSSSWEEAPAVTWESDE